MTHPCHFFQPDMPAPRAMRVVQIKALHVLMTVLVLCSIYLCMAKPAVAQTDWSNWINQAGQTEQTALVQAPYFIQSAAQWQFIARDVAMAVRNTVDEYVELRLLPVDVYGYSTGAFPEVYENLLKSELVKRDIHLPEQNVAQMRLQFMVQTVPSTSSQDKGEQEIIVSNRLFWKNRAILHVSSTHSVPVTDIALYRPFAGHLAYESPPLRIAPQTVHLQNEEVTKK